MSAEVSRNDVIAFRLNAHGLIRPSDDAGLLEAAGRCGVQNSPPGSALLALHARVRVVTREDMDRAVAEEKSLLQTRSMRGAPFFVPTADAWAFTTGVLPTTEAALRHLLPGVVQLVDRLGMSVCEAVGVTGAEIDDVLSGEQLAIKELGAALARRIAPKLSTGQREIWEEERPYPSGLPIGEAVVHFCIRVLALQGTVCFAWMLTEGPGCTARGTQTRRGATALTPRPVHGIARPRDHRRPDVPPGRLAGDR